MLWKDPEYPLPEEVIVWTCKGGLMPQALLDKFEEFLAAGAGTSSPALVLDGASAETSSSTPVPDGLADKPVPQDSVSDVLDWRSFNPAAFLGPWPIWDERIKLVELLFPDTEPPMIFTLWRLRASVENGTGCMKCLAELQQHESFLSSLFSA
jgi:hypothetical protein